MKLSPPIYFVFLTFVAFLSCDSSLKVDANSKTKMVMNGILLVNDTIEVELSTTRNLFDKEDQIDWVRNADVYLICPEFVLPEKLVYKGNGMYASQKHIAKYGGEYSIEVIHNTYDNISATAYMPKAIRGEVVFTGTTDDESNFEINIDNEDDNSYFIWEMLRRNSSGILSNVEITSKDSRTDNILPEETQVQEKIFLEDSNNLSGNINSTFSTSDISQDDFENAEIRLITVNEDMYKYFRSIELYKNSSRNFIKPVEIYSNVDNGLGIFGAISESVIPIVQ